MKCPNCGAEVHEEDKFCGECGKDLHVPKVRVEEKPVGKWRSIVALLGLFLVIVFVSVFTFGALLGGLKVIVILLIFGLPIIYLILKKTK